MADWFLLLAVAYGAVLFVAFAGLRVAGAADQSADRALLAMLDQRRRIGKSLARVRVRAHTSPRRRESAAEFLASSYR